MGAPDPARPEAALLSAPAAAVADPQMPPGAAALDVVCPYLRSPGGTWRGTRPQRDHRCWAQSPPATLSAQTQANLCLTAAHRGCGIYAAELQRRDNELARDRIMPARLSGSRFGALVQPVPLAIDAVGDHRLPTAPAERNRLAGAVLVGILAVVVLSVGIYILGSQVAGTGPVVGLASPSPSRSVQFSQQPSPPASSPIPTEPAIPSPSPIRTLTPQPSPTTPAILRTYHVKPGDTVRSLATRFHVTRAALLAVNNLGKPPVLAPGQVINIPAP